MAFKALRIVLAKVVHKAREYDCYKNTVLNAVPSS